MTLWPDNWRWGPFRLRHYSHLWYEPFGVYRFGASDGISGYGVRLFWREVAFVKDNK